MAGTLWNLILFLPALLIENAEYGRKLWYTDNRFLFIKHTACRGKIPVQDREGHVDMLRIAIVEDELSARKQIEKYIERYSEMEHLEIQTILFRDGGEILQNYQPVYDIILLDIEMPHVNGMDAAERIREMDSEVVLMFITNMAQYAIRGYAVGALDFVMKPLNYYTFSTHLVRAIKRVQSKGREQILLSLTDRVRKIDVRQIYYVEVQNRMLHYHTDEGEFILRGTMQSAEQQLAPHHFVRCNYWYILNLMHVTEVRKDIAVVAGHELEISRRNRTSFLTALTEYMGGGV